MQNMSTTNHPRKYSIGFLAGRFQTGVDLLRQVFGELEIQPCESVNDVDFYDGAALERLAKYVAEARGNRDGVAQ